MPGSMVSKGLVLFFLAVLGGLVVSGGSAGAQTVAAGEKAAAADYLLMVFMKPDEMRLAEFHQWYQGEHMREVINRPGFISARIYSAETSAFLPRHDHPNPVLIKYDIRSGDLAATFAEDSRLSALARLANPPLDAMATKSYTYEKLGAPVKGAGPRATGKGELKTYEFYSLNAPVTGREQDFNVWYDTHHVPEVVSTAGLVSGQRYRRSAVQRYSGAQSPPYMVVYTIVTDDLKAVFADLDARHDSYTPTDSVSAQGSLIFTYEALAPMTRKVP